MKPQSPGLYRDAGAIRCTVRECLETCAKPFWLEPGEEFFELTDDCYILDQHALRLMIEVRDERRNMVRRVVKKPRGGRMETVVEQFGGKLGSIWLVPDVSDTPVTALADYSDQVRAGFPPDAVSGVSSRGAAAPELIDHSDRRST